MKTLLATFISVICFCQFAQAQEFDYDTGKTYSNYKNEVSLEVLQLINGLYQLSYERYIWNNFTANLGVGYKGKEGLVKFSGLDGDHIKTDEIFYTGFQIIPEIRYYLKSTARKPLSGFYFGAYLKYSNYNSDLNGTYIDRTNTSYDVEFDMGTTITSVGLMFGYKLPISKHFNIDFMIAGPGSGNYKFRFENKRDLPDEFYDDLNNTLENHSILDIINSDFKFSQVNRSSKFSALSFRYGIAIGYTF
ncbi:conserved hypothetical protein (DUF3575) [Formosa agariphila KMM 3901]|uniref:DUF3575 domain-containing protein n=1 Tax=Formosa agariphila (strain DSM 15362 / KCTC 12365 / LMG 23005 / KMM 3901 / M-2Alg 35-1) TaxID=1347342 RepID=T2KKY9_FORAG|nr:DUF3575 domain-containing protein [Formosa agariphila]CDF79395.1 conserved hypothetical protein (DUF3575) [Formosa agariphila KMM 3901]